ncbi:MAG TPA: preprotein translocase subunit SecG [Candidatus Acidoferrales bacterium]|nr:preprotein translocase subunit SecG [Candidatus Acidoferrales bacterium]
MPGQVKWAISFLVGVGLILLGWRVPYLLATLHVLVCFLLVVVVLLQSGKAADLAGAFGGAGSQTAFGPRGAATFLSKATTWCAVMFMLTSMALVLRQERMMPAGSSVLQQFSKPTPKQTPPVTPAPVSPAPQGQTPQAPPAQPPEQTPAPQPPSKP